MKRSILFAAMCVLAACGPDAGEAFRKGVPTSDSVSIKVPVSKKALTSEGTRQDGLEGEKAAMYELTRGVSVAVNGGTAAVLDLVSRVAKYPPTSVNGNVAVWGPHTDALSPNTWRLTVTRVSTDNYAWELAGKGKTEADSAFRALVNGSHAVTGNDLGSGGFTIDWDAIAMLPEHDDNVGTAQITYERVSLTTNTTVNATFINVKDDKDPTKRVNALYKFVAVPQMGGTFDFKIAKDMAPGAAIETATVRSRWFQTGEGRSDVKLSGGDLAAPTTLNECWDTGFLSRVMVNGFAPNQNYGAESACAYTTANYSEL